MDRYKLINNILGWLVFAVASTVYILTCEPTASFWDPGEYIATAYKLQVGHPPGAPFFQLMGRFFSFFAFGDVKLVARMINTMSALFSGATIMFLFWTITAFARKIFILGNKEISGGNSWAIFAAGLVGSLAYTFSDSFWFSAVEGEVYATSSFFTAVVFWAILKWEAVADEPQSWRWLILIAFLIGLSIGVHLLNLLAIPAITFVYYFRKFKPSKTGFIITLGVSVLLLAAVMYGIIPQVVSLFAQTELFFVNSLGMPFNSGTLFFLAVIIAFIVSALFYAARPGKSTAVTTIIFSAVLMILIFLAAKSVWDFILRLIICSAAAVLIYFARRKYAVLKTTVLSLAFMLIGYSVFLILIIRANAGTPINENNPKDAISLLSYLNREQYGTWPILYGQYFNAPLDARQPYKDGNPVYERDDRSGKYVVVDSARNILPNYDKRFCTFFPRMWSNQQDFHASGYKSWGEIKGTPVTITGRNGKTETIYKPTFGENLRFFFSYQLNHMYFRYFMWNFAGKQNDMQGYGGVQKGNWLSGIKFLDEMRLGPQDNLPEALEHNRGRNKFYLLPLILGIIGLIYQVNKDSRNAFIVLLLFIFTGIAINVYLNIVPYQPRERDYAYAASFYAFAIWIGLGVTAVYHLLRKWFKARLSAVISFVVCFMLVPFIMAQQGWDDHDRSNRYTSVAAASNYLNSCAPNAILFTVGDNDTFPLWYAQEVEGIRTDVRVVNLSLLGSDWYIDQMKRKVYDSEPLPFTIPSHKYRGSKMEMTYVFEDTTVVPAGTFADIAKLVEYATSEDADKKLMTSIGNFNYFPTANFSLRVDSLGVIRRGLVPPGKEDSVFSRINWVFPGYGLQKNHMMILDLLAHFNWERPLYFAYTTDEDAWLGLQDYLRVEGFAYRLVPYLNRSIDGMAGKVDTKIMYDNVMNKFKWGNMNDPHVYLDEINRRLAVNLRSTFSRLAYALISENKKDSAAAVCLRCLEVMPDSCIPYDKNLIPVADVLYKCGKYSKANEICNIILTRTEQELRYYAQFTGLNAAYLSVEANEAAHVVETIGSMAKTYRQEELYQKAFSIHQRYGKP